MLVGLAVFFIGSAHISLYYENELPLLVQSNGLLGISTYVLITITAVVIAPVSTLPLIPIAVTIWGWQITAILSIIGWVIGSQIAFLLARRFGKKIILRFISLQKIEKFEQRLSKENIFWTVVLLRLAVPVDIFSYALGLFSTMKAGSFFLVTLS
ncbi:VTT domain-containing protein [Candidatus Parcubacteria bacterium]|nr:VTT domain-containing protein [Candidatus Parcubacteria bacterium]